MKTFLFTFILATITNATYAQEPRPKNSPTPSDPPPVEIVSQPDSPVRIVSIKTKWVRPDHSGIELYVVVENISDKTISAYTTLDDRVATGLNDCWTLSAKSPGKALKPGQSEGRSTWRGYDPTSPPRRLVDLVEFTDGTTWGADLCKSAESLASPRAGAREAQKLLLQIFATDGAEAVIRTVKAGLPELEPPPNHSPKWKQDFLAGYSSYSDVIKQVDQEWGYTEIECALKRPIGAVDEKKP